MQKAYYATLYHGEEIGPEVTECACRVIAATGIKIIWDKNL